MDWLQIIHDLSLLLGGGLISFLTTHWNAERNRKHEFVKEKNREKRDFIQSTALQFTKSHALYHQAALRMRIAADGSHTEQMEKVQTLWVEAYALVLSVKTMVIIGRLEDARPLLEQYIIFYRDNMIAMEERIKTKTFEFQAEPWKTLEKMRDDVILSFRKEMDKYTLLEAKI